MTSLEQITLVEAWAWLEVAGGLPGWDDAEKVGTRGHRRMEVLFFGHLRWKYTYIQPRWYKYALLGALDCVGAEIRVEDVKTEVDKKFKRKTPVDNPLAPELVKGDRVTEVLRNLPPFEDSFAGAHRLTMTMHALMRDNWAPALWYKDQGYPLLAKDLRDLRPDLSVYMINRKIREAEESNDD